jgi:hypothetical protein
MSRENPPSEAIEGYKRKPPLRQHLGQHEKKELKLTHLQVYLIM